METLGEFTGRLSEDLKCFYHKGKSETYSLKKVNTKETGKMGVFAWVQERKLDSRFEIATYQTRGDKCHVTSLADKIVPGMHGIVLFVGNGSRGPDYMKAIEALKVILSLRPR